jgi:hypothetical protein
VISYPWSLNNNRSNPRTSPRVVITLFTAIKVPSTYGFAPEPASAWNRTTTWTRLVYLILGLVGSGCAHRCDLTFLSVDKYIGDKALKENLRASAEWIQ